MIKNFKITIFMKKHLLSWVTIAMMAFVCVGFAACGSDDDNDGGEGGNAGSLVGDWKKVFKTKKVFEKNSSGEWELKRTEEKTYEGKSSSTGIRFKADGKAVELTVKSDGSRSEDDEQFQYKLEDGKLYMLELDQKDKDGWELLGPIVLSGDSFTITEEEEHGITREIEIVQYKKF